jgi:N-acetylmuramoyl-L-alanine amidase
MKKTFLFILCLALMMAGPLSAQKKAEVFLKYSRQEGSMRIVVEAEEPVIGKTEAASSSSQLSIRFPEPFHLNAPKEMPFQLIPSEKALLIDLKEKGEIKHFRLFSPARIVFDIQSPDIHPEKKQAGIVSNTFVLDAGHGGYDFGLTLKDINEKDLNLGMAKDLGAALSKKGKKVFPVRKVDQYLPLAARIAFANQKKPDIFISLHLSTTSHYVIYTATPDEQGKNDIVDAYSFSLRQKQYIEKSRALAESIGKTLKEDLQVDAIRRELPLPVLQSVGAPAVLIELPSPAFTAYDQQMKTKVINAIIKGIAAHGQ